MAWEKLEHLRQTNSLSNVVSIERRKTKGTRYMFIAYDLCVQAGFEVGDSVSFWIDKERFAFGIKSDEDSKFQLRKERGNALQVNAKPLLKEMGIQHLHGRFPAMVEDGIVVVEVPRPIEEDKEVE